MTLQIFLLGQFKLRADNHPIEIPSRPAQSLLAYLALNAGITHRREKLAGMLWPDSTETNARNYLRQALWRIRKTLESGSLNWEDYLEINKINVTFNENSDYWLDTNCLLASEKSQSQEDLIETVRWYQGELLPGFYDDWIGVERDRFQTIYHQKMIQLLEVLTHEGAWKQALEWSEQWIRFGHAPEQAFQVMMKAFAALGDLAMLQATYTRCEDAVERELGINLSVETTRLFEQLLDPDTPSSLPSPSVMSDLPIHSPRFLDDVEPTSSEKITFVARETELQDLESHLDSMFTRQGKVIFITGEVGSGKTAILNEFTRRALERHAELIVASGHCNAHTGMGDPYLPFREILGQLTGDVEARLEAGAITKEHAHRLWQLLPNSVDAMLDSGPDLIDTFLPGVSLIGRAASGIPGESRSLRRLRDIVERQGSSLHIPSPQQSDLFEQYSRMIQAISRKNALILVLDDLQWADAGSIDLLFHLGRKTVGYPILIVGAYRQEEVTMGREGTRHPLEPVVNEFQREFGAITVNLGQANRRQFVEALLESEPNQLELSFKEMLYRQTQGHPLFTIELLRGMQERGDLIQDGTGAWIEGFVLDWETMPARVEAVIAERIDRLPPQLRSALRVASVEGEIFTAEVIARVLERDDRLLLSELSGELDKKHRIIQADSIHRSNGQLLSNYRFRHILFQKYLYNTLDEVERVHIHEQVGTVLEKLVSTHEEIPNVVLQLARHFEEAEITEKAIQYLHQAGDRAIQLTAVSEAVTHLTKALDLLDQQPVSSDRDEKELSIQLSMGKVWKYEGPTSDASIAINRARELCQRLGKTTQLSRVLGELSIFHYVQAEYQQALEFASDALGYAEQANDQFLKVEGHWLMGFLGFCRAEYAIARDHLEHVISFYDPEKHHQTFIRHRGVDPGLSAMAYQALCLWSLGFPDQAMVKSKRALSLAYEFDHDFTRADVLCFAGCKFNEMRRDAQGMKENAENLLELIVEKDLDGWRGHATRYKGVALAMQGESEKAIPLIREGIDIGHHTGELLYKSVTLCSLAQALVDLGQFDEGNLILAEALEVVEQRGERHWEAELYRTQAEFLLLDGNDSEAERSFKKAIEVSRQQQAKSWELRASIGLARLWHKQGRFDEARQLMMGIYNWFSEGFDTPDLQEAKALLERIG